MEKGKIYSKVKLPNVELSQIKTETARGAETHSPVLSRPAESIE
jgi:hypothetical protein